MYTLDIQSIPVRAITGVQSRSFYGDPFLLLLWRPIPAPSMEIRHPVSLALDNGMSSLERGVVIRVPLELHSNSARIPLELRVFSGFPLMSLLLPVSFTTSSTHPPQFPFPTPHFFHIPFPNSAFSSFSTLLSISHHGLYVFGLKFRSWSA